MREKVIVNAQPIAPDRRKPVICAIFKKNLCKYRACWHRTPHSPIEIGMTSYCTDEVHKCRGYCGEGIKCTPREE